MLLVIPASSTDRELIAPFAAIVRKFGPYPDHDALFVSRPADAAHAVRLYNRLGPLFRSARIHCFQEDGTLGWPQGPNWYFQQTIFHLIESGNASPWLWMELDMTPLRPGWADELETAYRSAGTACMGWTEDTTTHTTDKVVIPLCKHLVGAAIYPPDLHLQSDLWRHIDRIGTAFDVLMQWELVPRTKHTELFNHGFRTVNYRQTGPSTYRGRPDRDPSAGYQLLRYDRPVDIAVSAIHHGCTDGSLARLLLSR